MALRYYPAFRIKPNQSTTGGQYSLNGRPYIGKYYITYDGQVFSGADPISGPNEKLEPLNLFVNNPVLTNSTLPRALVDSLASTTGNLNNQLTANIQKNATRSDKPTPYYPYPIAEDYTRGYITRYFIKKINNIGYITEISEEEFIDVQNGDVLYDIKMYMYNSILWKLTGPLNSVRLSQYDTREGIIDTNKRLTEKLNLTMLGITDFIGGQYDKFARPS
jgi:hypothetical protein